MSNIKAIIFDCFGVLIADVVRTKANEIRLTHPQQAEDMLAILRTADRGMISRHESVNRLSNLLGISYEEMEKLLAKGEVRNNSLISEIPHLREGYKIGLLSNVASRDWVQDRFGEELDRYFDEVIVSGEVGSIKPEPEIYYVAADKLGVKPEECVMIDDINRNVDGAISVGMKGILYHNPSQVMDDLKTLLTD